MNAIIHCECGLVYVGVSHKKRHEQTATHKRKIAEKEIE